VIDRLEDIATRISFDSEQKEVCCCLSGDFKHHRSGPIVLKQASAFLELSSLRCEAAKGRRAGRQCTHKNQSGRSLTAASKMLRKKLSCYKILCLQRESEKADSVCLRGCGSDLMFVISAGAARCRHGWATCCSNYLLIRAKCPWLFEGVCFTFACLYLHVCARASVGKCEPGHSLHFYDRFAARQDARATFPYSFRTIGAAALIPAYVVT
jgi:hypothetical protein